MRLLVNFFRNRSENAAGFFKQNVRSVSLKAKTFNSRHVKEGDPLPPFNGTLRLYGMRFSPFVQKVALILNAKNIDYELINIDLVNRPKWIYTMNPKGKVPILEIKEGVTIHESLIASEYIDDAYPEIRLKSEDPLVRAKDRAIIHFSTMISKFLIHSLRVPSVDPDGAKLFYGYLDYAQDEILNRGTRFLHGDRPGFVDYMIWPWFERLPCMKSDSMQFWPLGDDYGRLVQYIWDMRKDPAVSEYLVPENIMTVFMKQFGTSHPKYDELDAELERHFKENN